MCIAYLAIGCHPDWPLFIAANRDEFHQRPTLSAAPWPDFPDVIAGIDIQAHGTWLGVTRQGRFAFLTNYRDLGSVVPNAPSRGELVGRYLTQDDTPQAYAQRVLKTSAAYNGFNLVVGDLNSAYYVGNRTSNPTASSLKPGQYALSNHLLDTPWPKVERLRLALNQYPLEQLEHSLNPVFEILKDNTQATDNSLPKTGLSLDRERLLSSPFIISPEYGTRCSSIIAIHASGRAIFSEVSFDPSGHASERHDWPFSVQNLAQAPR